MECNGHNIPASNHIFGNKIPWSALPFAILTFHFHTFIYTNAINPYDECVDSMRLCFGCTSPFPLDSLIIECMCMFFIEFTSKHCMLVVLSLLANIKM